MTKTSQIYMYLELYSGPDYIIHYKYSGVLNIVYVTMLYGIGLPMLFPIAFLSLFIIYATERYMIAYTYQLPPAMDDRMTENAVKMLSYTPILFLMNGYWMLSNRQMFDNVINTIALSTQQMPSGHSFASISYLDQATPMLLMVIPIVIIMILRLVAYPLLSKWGFVISTNVISVDENLPKFFEAVKLQDADWFVKESKYLLDQYLFTFANKKVVD